MKVWIDDVRQAPDGWHWAKTVDEATRILNFSRDAITHISLDHDDGIDSFKPVARFIALLQEYYRAVRLPWDVIITIHSANPIGRKEITAILERAH